jgi:hypothetical protein
MMGGLWMTYLPAATTLTVTFDEARARAAAAGRNTRRPITASTSATPGRAGPCDWVVDKATGEVTVLYGLMGHDPVPNLRPINNPPE